MTKAELLARLAEIEARLAHLEKHAQGDCDHYTCDTCHKNTRGY